MRSKRSSTRLFILGALFVAMGGTSAWTGLDGRAETAAILPPTISVETETSPRDPSHQWVVPFDLDDLAETPVFLEQPISTRLASEAELHQRFFQVDQYLQTRSRSAPHRGEAARIRDEVWGEIRFRSQVKEMLKFHEGYKTHRYRDRKGYWTVGVGFNLHEKRARLILNEVGADYTRVRRGEASMTRQQIEHALELYLDAVIEEAIHYVPNYDRLPEGARMVVIDMLYVMGGGRFSKFNRFRSALEKENWGGAVAEIRNSRFYKVLTTRATRLIRLIEAA